VKEYISYIKLEARCAGSTKMMVGVPSEESKHSMFELLLRELGDAVLGHTKNLSLIELKNRTTIRVVSDIVDTKGYAANILVFPYDKDHYDQSFLYNMFPLVSSECHTRIIGLV